MPVSAPRTGTTPPYDTVPCILVHRWRSKLRAHARAASSVERRFAVPSKGRSRTPPAPEAPPSPPSSADSCAAAGSSRRLPVGVRPARSSRSGRHADGSDPARSTPRHEVLDTTAPPIALPGVSRTAPARVSERTGTIEPETRAPFRTTGSRARAARLPRAFRPCITHYAHGPNKMSAVVPASGVDSRVERRSRPPSPPPEPLQSGFRRCGPGVDPNVGIPDPTCSLGHPPRRRVTRDAIV